MHRDPGGCLLRRWNAENIQAKIVAHDAGQQSGIRAIAILRMLITGILRGLDGWPRRCPKRVHSSLFVEDFGDVTAFLQHGDTQFFVFEYGGPPTAVCCFSHGRSHYAMSEGSTYAPTKCLDRDQPWLCRAHRRRLAHRWRQPAADRLAEGRKNPQQG